MPKIIWSALAEQDLGDIWDYIAQDSVVAADKLLRGIHAKLELYALHPLMGRDRSSFIPGLLSFSFGNYLIFYRALNEGIELVRVVHSAREFKNLLNPRHLGNPPSVDN